VDVNKVKTTVKDGVLELDLAKAAPDKHTPAAA
jgi:HSP20 family molecular chaperone IbpA